MQISWSFFLPILFALFMSGCQDPAVNADKGVATPYKDYPFRAVSFFKFDMSEKAFQLSKGEQKKLANATLAYHLDQLHGKAFMDQLLESLGKEDVAILRDVGSGIPPTSPPIESLVIFEARVRETSSYLVPALEIIAYSNVGQGSCSLVLNKVIDLYPGFARQSDGNGPGSRSQAAYDQLIKEIQGLELEQQSFRKGHNIVNFNVAKASIATEISAVKDVQLGNDIERKQILALLGKIHSAFKNDQDPSEIEEVSTYGKVSIFQSRIAELEAKQGLTQEGSQVWNALQEEKEEIGEQILSEIQTSIRIMKEKILTLDTMEEQIQKELKKLDLGIRKLEKLEVEDKILTSSIERKSQRLDQLVNGMGGLGDSLETIPAIKIIPGPKSVPPEDNPQVQEGESPTSPAPRP